MELFLRRLRGAYASLAPVRDRRAQFRRCDMKVTKREIDKITLPAQGQKFYWDDALQGFGLRVTPSGISYVVQGTVRGGGRRPRITLGRHGPLSPDMARGEARKALGEME